MDQKRERAFRELKTLLCSNPVLQSPDLKKEFILQTDASEFGVGAVLSQLDDSSTDHPVCFSVESYFSNRDCLQDNFIKLLLDILVFA